MNFQKRFDIKPIDPCAWYVLTLINGLVQILFNYVHWIEHLATDIKLEFFWGSGVLKNGYFYENSDYKFIER